MGLAVKDSENFRGGISLEKWKASRNHPELIASLQKKPRGDRWGSVPADQEESVCGEVSLHPRSLPRIIRAMPEREQARGCLDTDC